MGISMSLYSVDEPVLTRMLARPELCLEMIAPAEVERFELGLELVDDEGHGFEKSWHGVHYLLTGSAWETSSTFSCSLFPVLVRSEPLTGVEQRLLELSLQLLARRQDSEVLGDMNSALV